MIHELSIENFFSIADCQKVSFDVNEKAPDIPSYRTTNSFSSPVRTSAIIGFFGPNASGKSTVLRAISTVVRFLSSDPNFNGEFSQQFQPYKQKIWRNKPTKIRIAFDGQLAAGEPSCLFIYELHIDNSCESGKKVVLHEALFYLPNNKPRRLFKRDHQDITFGKDFLISIKNMDKAVRDDISIIDAMAMLNHKPSMHISSLMSQIHMNESFGIPADIAHQLMLFKYKNNPQCLADLNQELVRFDMGLKSMQVQAVSGKLFAKFEHEGLDGYIDFNEESSGTQKFIAIFLKLHFALTYGSVVLIDELDVEFHPLILPELFRWFSDPVRNKYNAQLIFTAHNPTILDELEKEQLFLIQKEHRKPSSIYRISSIKGLRRAPSLQKKYLSGELGAIPYIG